MTVVRAQRRKFLFIAAAAAIVFLFFLTSSSSLDVSKLDIDNFSGLFDPRPEELDTDLQDSMSENGRPKKWEGAKIPQKETGEKEDPKNPGGYLGDVSEFDQHEELPKTNADDPDLEEQLASKGDSYNINLDNKPATIEELAYPEVPGIAGVTFTNPIHVRIYSHNVKNGEKREMAAGEAPWEERRSDVVASIKLHMAPNMVVMLQEALDYQLQYIVDQLNLMNEDKVTDWIALGGGRINGKTIGEYVPIIVRESDWEVVYSDTFWLKEGDTRTSITGWDAEYPRICTYATLKNKDTGAYINMFNTHFDPQGKTARIESAKLIAQKMKSVNEWPSFLSGDLNSKPDDKCHQYLTGLLKDAHELASTYNRYGHREFTVTGFLGVRGTKGERTDYIFAPKDTKKISEQKCTKGEKLNIHLESYAILHSKYGGLYMSDHRPVMAQFKIGGC